jgi:hypothetical protein
MNRTPHLHRYRSNGYDPFATRVEQFVRCSVCGFKGIDALKWQEPEQAVFSTVTTGTTYQIPAGTTVEQLATAVDRTTAVTYGTYAGCPLCGSPNWSWGSAPDLLR